MKLLTNEHQKSYKTEKNMLSLQIIIIKKNEHEHDKDKNDKNKISDHYHIIIIHNPSQNILDKLHFLCETVLHFQGVLS